jgi:hypothetical protein
MTVSATKLKVTCVLKADEILAVPVPDGKPRVVLRIKLPDRVLSADIAAKSLRRAQATIREVGADGVAVLLQGNLVANDVVADAGLSAQPKAPKKEAACVEVTSSQAVAP